MSEPDEVLFEARPRGYVRPSWWDLTAYGLVLAVGLLMLMEVIAAARHPTVTWRWTWGVVEVHGMGPATLPSGAQVITGVAVSGPNPLAWLLLVLALEGWRAADLKSHVYRVAAGALHVERGVVRRRTSTYPLTGGEQVEPHPRGARVRLSDGARVLLAGLDAEDAGALAAALRGER